MMKRILLFMLLMVTAAQPASAGVAVGLGAVTQPEERNPTNPEYGEPQGDPAAIQGENLHQEMQKNKALSQLKPLQKAKLFFIVLGASQGVDESTKVGCGDSLGGVDIGIAGDEAPLTTVLKTLLAIHDKQYAGFYNTLYQSRLSVKSVTIQGGQARVALTGQLKIGGECDAPRAIAQLETTIRQFSTVKTTVITVNGVSLQQALNYSGKP